MKKSTMMTASSDSRLTLKTGINNALLTNQKSKLLIETALKIRIISSVFEYRIIPV